MGRHPDIHTPDIVDRQTYMHPEIKKTSRQTIIQTSKSRQAEQLFNTALQSLFKTDICLRHQENQTHRYPDGHPDCFFDIKTDIQIERKRDMHMDRSSDRYTSRYTEKQASLAVPLPGGAPAADQPPPHSRGRGSGTSRNSSCCYSHKYSRVASQTVKTGWNELQKITSTFVLMLN